MSKRLQRTLDALEAIEEARTSEALAERVERVVNSFGFSGFGIARFGDSAGRRFTQLHGVVNPDWMQKYLRGGYSVHDPVVARASFGAPPFVWSSGGSYDLSAKAKEVCALAREAGIVTGFTVPWLADGADGAVTVAGSRNDMDPAERSALLAVAWFYWESHRALQHLPQTSLTCPLDGRQLDCLAWAAEGRTDWEIAERLTIPQSLAADLIQSARRQLNASSRAQAVIIAMKRGWLPLKAAPAAMLAAAEPEQDAAGL